MTEYLAAILAASRRRAASLTLVDDLSDRTAAMSEWHTIAASDYFDAGGQTVRISADADNHGVVNLYDEARSVNITPTRLGTTNVTLRGITDDEQEVETDYQITVTPDDLFAGLPDMPEPTVYYLNYGDDPCREMTVHWNTEAADSDRAVLEYRADGASEWTLYAGTHVRHPFTGDEAHDHPRNLWPELNIHTVKLLDLTPGQLYEFRLRQGGTIHRFRMPPLSLSGGAQFKLGICADLSTSSTRSVFMAARELNVDAMAISGDIAYDDGVASRSHVWLGGADGSVAGLWESMIPWLKRESDDCIIPIIAGMGNHEVIGFYRDDKNLAPYFYRQFSWPQRGYGFLDFGDWLSLFMGDTNHTAPVLGSQYDIQTQYLDDGFEARKAASVKHLIPTYHVPAYPTYKDFRDIHSFRVRENWTPIFDRHGITVAFEHHDHTYKRTVPLRGGQPTVGGLVYYGDGWRNRDVINPSTTPWLDEAYGITYLPGTDELSSDPHPDTGTDADPQKAMHFNVVTLRENDRTIQSVSVGSGVLTNLDIFHELIQAADA